MRKAGRHFLQIPGPSAVPDRILSAISQQTIDHRGPAFAKVGLRALEGLKTIFKTDEHVFIFPASGTGAWEAALVNTLSPGDHVLMYETGHFATLWKKLAEKLGLKAEFIEGDWRGGADPERIEARLAEDKGHEIKAVCVVHNETSTGSVSPIAEVRKAIDRANHPALFMVDTISGLASLEYKHDEWGVDVTVSGSQKGLMLPPGLSFNAASAKALAANKTAKLQRSYWDWADMLGPNKTGYFPYTPATNMLYGLNEAIDMLHEEGLENVFERHARHGAATRAAVRTWGLEVLCATQGQESGVLTAVKMPEGESADAFRATTLEHFDISLGNGLSKVADKVFRIGHLGDFNDLMLVGTLAGVEMGLKKAGVPHEAGGVQAAMKRLA
ncbi:MULTISPECIES: pyridoxal-phosphate-dependent aminotransferase family protein [unclassified Sulfitobacter]|jgi:alanine-glyoxylate transaminase / serine-glyoxylate transaminase / serine-pyruvate transaminase|uniref:pyridoxal-phosphate-dependent aminotransferase family protein n=1 Tax=unclassified Sulfitobacter TaxID=196795 RepID=UPI0007C20910|nr:MULTISPECIES: aminotransferase class V-fold PLP-dependent enzyme [unclassified Sulfitobacter]KZY06228.1 serine--glyoxylate aminotransferase [Sulfitobacter sp. HI0023]KZY25188.1 serine--glyoxylate aminotransferase [Sulfitobacter sp. HI0040]KZZ67030.1 serine--glyoxylate aminotransferase [Sulfitobacter sp. HI0129]